MHQPMLRLLVSASLFTCLLTPTHALSSKASFSPAEHNEIGNQITLRYSVNEAGHTGEPIPLANGLQLTYGEIISMVDFYGLTDEPIARGKTDAERRTRFLAAFHTLSQDKKALDEVPQLISVFKEERKLVTDAISQGKSIDEVYEDIGVSFDIKYNCITGGGCTPATWLINLGRYLKLANTNYDHFNPDAWVAYQTGHQLAMEEAILARQTNDPGRLKLAYAMNAFASHYLTDRFAAGHMRTPRTELADHTTPSIVGSAIATYMHGEENSSGLHVSNQRGDHWIAYGDKTYFKPQTEAHRKIIHEAVQASADQVFSAYQNGYISNEQTVDALIPTPDEVNTHNQLDISPMFYWDQASNTLYRRTQLPQPFDRNWTDNWWGWSTLLELRNERGIENIVQAELAHSSLRFQALKDGLITEPSLVAYVKRQAH